MKASELMIGDWVIVDHCSSRLEPCYGQVTGIDKDGEDVHTTEGMVDASLLKPVPLTPEILERNGFEAERNVGYVYNDWNETEVIFDTFDHRLRILYRRDVVLDIEEWDFPVHMLQHALRLCGVDKEIKLEEK